MGGEGRLGIFYCLILSAKTVTTVEASFTIIVQIHKLMLLPVISTKYYFIKQSKRRQNRVHRKM